MPQPGSKQRRLFKNIVIVGCGSIGLPLAAAFASRGIEVLGYDVEAARLARIASGAPMPTEPDLAVAIRSALDARKLQFSTDLDVASEPRAYIIAVPTPWREEGGFDDRPLQAAIEAIFNAAQAGDAICIRSTVPVGTTAALTARAEARGLDIDVASTPDRSVEGRSFQEQFEIPHLIGAGDRHSGRRIAALFAILGEIVICGSPGEAEIAKLLCNVTRDVQFGLANEIARLCDQLGLDGHAVCAAASKGYSRFALPRFGPVGGPCLAKDTNLLLSSAGASDSMLIRSARAANYGIAVRVAETIKQHVAEISIPIVTLLGVAFKGRPAVADLRGSTTLDIADLLRHGPPLRLTAWDPEIDASALLDAGLLPGATAMEAASGAAAIVLANDHPALAALDLDALMAAAHPRALIYDLCGHTLGRPLTLRPGQVLHILGGGRRTGSASSAIA